MKHISLKEQGRLLGGIAYTRDRNTHYFHAHKTSTGWCCWSTFDGIVYLTAYESVIKALIRSLNSEVEKKSLPECVCT